MVESESSKRLKPSKGSGRGIDRISNLPVPLISQILSLLPTKCAVATSVLSTKWKFLWTSIANIDIDNYLEVGHLSEMELKSMRNKFTLFVNRVFLLLNPPSIQTLRLTLGQALSDPSYITSWITDAIGRTVRDLDLFLGLAELPFPHLAEPMELPLSHIHCNIVVLKLGGDIHFNIPAAASVSFPSLHTLHLHWIALTISCNSSVSFPNLKIMRLEYVHYANEDSVHKLFTNCPILDDLSIKRNHWDNVLCFIIRIPSLTSLSLTFNFRSRKDGEYKLQIDTPGLQYLNLQDDIPCEYLPSENLSSLLQAKVKWRYIDEGDVQCHISIFKFIEGFSKVRFLSVSDCAITAIRTALANFSAGFHNLTRLELEEHNCIDSSILINNFLESMDNLEHLVMKGWSCNRCKHYWWTEHLNVPKCLLLRVTTISITCMRNDCRGQLELLQYFLKNAEVLQQLTISFRLHCYGKLELFQKISEYPRGSQTCQVTLT